MFSTNELKRLAEIVAENIQQEPFEYLPKRSKKRYPSVQGWSERFSNYYWSSSTEPLSDWEQINQLTERLGVYAQRLAAKERIDSDIEAATVNDVFELFKWGGVLRGKDHNPPSIKIINQVISSAIEYNINTDAPMDSAWTKLAAFSTAWLEENTDKPPHIIYDSRVSVALLERIDQAVEMQSNLVVLKNRLNSAGLGYVDGRGGNRKERVQKLKQKKWSIGYGKWSSQIISSKIIDAIVLELNSKTRYGKMRYKNCSYSWNARGVEMVLFMEGY
jgi:hypothetical protein